MADKSEAIEKAVVTLHQLSEDKKIKLQCEARERYWMDWQSSMRTNYQKGQAAERANTLKEKERADKEELTTELLGYANQLQEIEKSFESHNEIGKLKEPEKMEKDVAEPKNTDSPIIS